MVIICDAFATGAVSLVSRRCPGPLLGLASSVCSGVCLQCGHVVSEAGGVCPCLAGAGCWRMSFWAAVGRRSAVDGQSFCFVSLFLLCLLYSWLLLLKAHFLYYVCVFCVSLFSGRGLVSIWGGTLIP